MFTVGYLSYQNILNQSAHDQPCAQAQHNLNRFMQLFPQGGVICNLEGRTANFVHLKWKMYFETVTNKKGKQIFLEDDDPDYASITDFHLNFEPQTFDGVWAHQALSFQKKKRILHILKKVHKFLKDDGFFYFSVKLNTGMTDESHTNTLQSIYTEDEIDQLLDKTGFKIVDKGFNDHMGTWMPIICQKTMDESKKIRQRCCC